MIGNKIRKLRLERNLTQAEICTAINMSQNAYSLLENGKTRVDHDRIIRIANYFKINPSSLLDEHMILEMNLDLEISEKNLANEPDQLSDYLKQVIADKDKQLELLLRENEILMYKLKKRKKLI